MSDDGIDAGKILLLIAIVAIPWAIVISMFACNDLQVYSSCMQIHANATDCIRPWWLV